MPDYPDILDHLGKTPREFGALHVHVEPVSVDDGWGWTTVWFQAAFEPTDPTATFELFCAGSGLQPLREAQRVPALDRGVVLKGNVRFKLPDDALQVVLKVRSSLPRGAERCRPAWKLFDTFEIAKESEMRPAPSGGINFGESAFGTLLGAPLGVAVVSYERDAPGPRLADAVRTTVHKARDMPDGFVVEIVRDAPRAQPPGEGFAPFWAPGQALPEVQPVAAVPMPAARAGPKDGRKECGRCGFGGKWADYGSDRFCPGCGHDWT